MADQDWLAAAENAVDGVGGFDDSRHNERDTRALVGGASALISMATDMRSLRETMLPKVRRVVEAARAASNELTEAEANRRGVDTRPFSELRDAVRELDA